MNSNSKKTRNESGGILKASDATSEVYDQYFEDLKNLSAPRAAYRVRIGVKLIGSLRGNSLAIGIGNLSEARELKSCGFNPVLCDISAKAVGCAQQNGYEAFVCDISNNSPSGKYDFIFCFEVLEHLVNPLKALMNLKKSLSERGLLVVSLPNEFNILARLSILVGRPVFGGHDWHHLRFFNRKLGEKMFEEAGLEIIKRDYCPRVPLWNKFSIIFGEILQKISPNLFSLSTVWVLKARD